MRLSVGLTAGGPGGGGLSWQLRPRMRERVADDAWDGVVVWGSQPAVAGGATRGPSGHS